jgi:isoleucyl-tRNA synthetase
MDYKHTLNITLSDKDPGAMPQRGNLPAREPEIQKFWEEIDLYTLSVTKPAPLGTFILHDGPPYSNGDIHLGHALNKIAKDIIVKYRTMEGYCAPFVPGWDNHGMPIENEVAKEFRRKGEKPDRITMRKRCREYAAKWVEIQKQQFKRLGVRGDWNHPYLTMSTDFEAKIVETFGILAQKGYIYRGLKPVLWCPSCETALADAEVEYAEHTSRSIYVRFPIQNDPKRIFGNEETNPPHAYIAIWTTTPWTIPANLALAVHPYAHYVILQVDGEKYLLAEPRLEAFQETIGQTGSILRRLQGSELEGLIARHPVLPRPSPVIMATYVTMEDGTGVVHTAPGHGKEDFESGQKYGLEILCPVDPAGVLTEKAGEPFAGTHILGGEADRRVVEALKQSGHLLSDAPYTHSYPHCWRCHSPLIFRATVQWFMNIDHNNHRQRALEQIEATTWYPPVSKNRISSMVASRPDWCLSRQRAWGVGIPAFYCTTCGKEVLTRESIEAVHQLVATEGSDAWYARSAEEILPTHFRCPQCGGTRFEKETDILDVWFDSGSTHLAVLENPRWPLLNHWPADLYLEGSDQHRGWFNSSLMVAVGVRGKAPYKAVITNGWTLDEEGRAMHKSWGNAVSPVEVIEKYGADILRLWVASTDYFEDVRCSENILRQVAETYRRIRNTFRFLVNNLYDFDPATDAVPEEAMHALDQWTLAQLQRVIVTCRAGYNSYEFHRVYHAIHNFCAVELSAFYLDVIKDRLYCDAATSWRRRSAQTVLFTLADGMSRLLAPILSHTAEEVWSHLKMPDKPRSVQLAGFPQAQANTWEEVLKRWEPVLKVRDGVNQAVEAARQEKMIINPLEARAEITLSHTLYEALSPMAEDLHLLFKISQVDLQKREEPGEEISIRVVPAPGRKCARCWLVRTDVGENPNYSDLCPRCAEVVTHLEEMTRLGEPFK